MLFPKIPFTVVANWVAGCHALQAFLHRTHGLQSKMLWVQWLTIAEDAKPGGWTPSSESSNRNHLRNQFLPPWQDMCKDAVPCSSMQFSNLCFGAPRPVSLKRPTGACPLSAHRTTGLCIEWCKTRAPAASDSEQLGCRKWRTGDPAIILCK